MATSSTFSTSNGYVVYNITVTENSTSVANNSSNVTVKVNFWRTNTGYTTYGTGTVYCTINGTKYSQAVTTSQTITENSRTLFSKTLDIPHNTDGSKSLTCSAYIDLGSILSSDSHSFTTALTTIARASTISSVTSLVTVDGTNTCTVNISRKSTSFTHTVIFSIGSYSYTKEDVATSFSYAIPMSWLNSIPSATSGTAKVKVITYNGTTKVGTGVSENFTIKVPSTVIPTISSVTSERVDGTVPSSWGIYVKNKSKCKLTIGNFTGAYGSTVSSYSISGGGFSSTTTPYTTGYLNTAGNITFTAKATDSRGRVSSAKTTTITVVDYSSPSLSSTNVIRCTSDGTADSNGTYLKATVSYVYSSCSSRNNAICSVKYKLSTDTSWSSSQTVTSGSSIILGDGAISADNTYQVMFTLTDTFTTITKTSTIGGAFKIFNIGNSGKAIAFGKKATTNGVEFDMDTYFNKSTTFKSAVYLSGSYIYPTGTLTSGAVIGYNTSTDKVVMQYQNANLKLSSTILELSAPTINFNNDTHFTGSTNYLYMSSDNDCSMYYADSSSQLTIRNSGDAYVRLTKTGVIIHGTEWATGSGTAAYITSSGNVVKYSSSKRYKTALNYDIDRQKYHNELMSFKPLEYSYKSSKNMIERGMIAEDVAEINKELVVADKLTGLIESYKDRDIITMLIVEAQEKDKIISQLTEKIQDVSDKLELLYNKKDDSEKG